MDTRNPDTHSGDDRRVEESGKLYVGRYVCVVEGEKRKGCFGCGVVGSRNDLCMYVCMSIVGTRDEKQERSERASDDHHATTESANLYVANLPSSVSLSYLSTYL